MLNRGVPRCDWTGWQTWGRNPRASGINRTTRPRDEPGRDQALGVLRGERPSRGDCLRGTVTRFDVVVVGGGAAGCVVAARLAEQTTQSVLLLEAGADRRSDLPREFLDGWRLPREFDWGLKSEPDQHGAGKNLRRVRLLGGSSWVTRFAVRGAAADFNAWAARGNPGWGFQDVLPYFNKLESDADFGGRAWHGASGPIPVRRYLDIEPSEVMTATLGALETMGFPAVEDHNHPGAVGSGRMPMNSNDGIRVTTADAYLPLGRTPANLTVRAEQQVADIVFDGSRVTGVRLTDGTVIEAGSVVLSAGVYGSPPILMRSGIGPAAHLRSVGIPLRRDLPGVGANLADHPGVDFERTCLGAGSDSSVLHSIATFRSAAASSDAAPDLMLWFSDPAGTPPVFSIEAVLLKPRSRGTVQLRSAEPAAPPRIVLPSLHEPSDVERLADGYRQLLEVVSRPEVRRLWDRPPPQELRRADDLRCYVRENVYSIPHVVGTCAMGPSPEEGAVVDASGRVHGIERLFVVDASIIPDAPSGFPHLIAIMFAERLSEEIARLL
jgi:choline dehydrogenase-like flavoprotein